MSRNDLNEWTDSLDFESLADEQTGGGFADPDAEPAAGTETLDLVQELGEDPAPDLETAVQDESELEAPPPGRSGGRPRRARVSGGGLGVLFALAIVVAAIGLAGALVTALGIDPVSLWQPQSLLQFDRIVDFNAHPLHLLYIVALATVVLAVLGAGSVARAVGKLDRDAARNARMVDKLTALRIDEEKGWQDPLFKLHPTAAAFVNENVGAWRLGEARQRRSAGLEGELQRLLRAASTNNRDVMNAHFDNPTVGTLADELLRHHDQAQSAGQEAAAIRAKDREEAERLMALITEACGWTNAAMDKVGVQGSAVDRLASSLRRLADGAGARGQEDPVARAAAAVAALRGNLKTLLQAAEPAAAGDLDDLVDRSNKLAFQIAMEVARLGPRGERLLPMTQALEELATEFRQVAESSTGPALPDDSFAAADHTLQQVQAALEDASQSSANWRKVVRDAAPAATEAAAQLTGLTSGFNGQVNRLNRAGEACGLMTGLTFDPSAVAPIDPVELPEPDLGFTRFDPFGAKGNDLSADLDQGPALEVDPFSSGEPEPVVTDFGADDPDPFLAEDPDPVYDLAGFNAQSVEPQAPVVEPDPLARIAPAAQPAPPVTKTAAPVIKPVAQVTKPAAPVIKPAAPAAKAEEDVLDLAAFGAVRLDDDTPGFAAPQGGAEAAIHDLSEFGAVSLD